MNLSEKLLLPKVKVDMGCGIFNRQQPAEEWIYLDGNKDVSNLDVCCMFNAIPFEDKSVDVIFAGDVIEHIPPYEIGEVLTEWNRILKVGGVLHGRMPNLHSTMKRYASGELKLDDAIGALYGSNEHIFQHHFITYTPFTLSDLLEKYGFGFIDYNGSPGNDNPMDAWWIVFHSVKTKDI